MIRNLVTLNVIILLFYQLSSFAGEADVINVDVKETNNGQYHFSVTVMHEDTGWDHYADRWEITDEKENVLATRVLYHPHVKEQPFTRSLSGVTIPGDIKTVTIRAHDSIHQYGGKVMINELPDR